MTDLFRAVRLFNEACGVRLRLTPGWVPDEEIALALRLVDEELSELRTAIEAADIVETADAIADSLYVLAGLVLRLGVARVYIQDLLFTPRVPAGMLSGAGARFESVGPQLDRIDGMLASLHQAVDARNLNGTDSVAHSLMYALQGVADWMLVPLEAVFAEVQSSNMSKLVDGKAVRRADGKVLKPATWMPPDIAGVLAAHGWAIGTAA